MEKDSRQGYVVSRLRTYDGKGIFVRATSASKPGIPDEMREKWQSFINHVAAALHQPHALITRLDQDTLYVFLHNDTPDTTFIDHDKFPLGLGVYCETTMTRNAVNFVPDALQDANWQDNPSVAFSLISYIGVPIRWPDGEVFGTVCALGDKPMVESVDLFNDIALFKAIVETDLQLLVEKQKGASRERHFNTALSEMHHRIKNHLNILTGLIQLERVGEGMTREEFIAYQDKLGNQIKAVAELHTLLAYESHESVELSSYLGRMIEGWIKAASNREIKVDTSLDKVEVAGDKVVYLGVLLNELITNSFTHAFGPDHPDPTITMVLEEKGDTFRFTYRDNGPGFVTGQRSDASKSLGLSMINELAAYMGGTVTREDGPGTSFVFVFPKRLE